MTKFFTTLRNVVTGARIATAALIGAVAIAATGAAHAQFGGHSYQAQHQPQGPMASGQNMSPQQYFAGTWQFQTSQGVMVTQFAPNGQYVSNFFTPNGQPMGQGRGTWKILGMNNGVFQVEIVNMASRKPARMVETYMPVDANSMRYGDGGGYRIG